MTAVDFRNFSASNSTSSDFSKCSSPATSTRAAKFLALAVINGRRLVGGQLTSLCRGLLGTERLDSFESNAHFTVEMHLITIGHKKDSFPSWGLRSLGEDTASVMQARDERSPVDFLAAGSTVRKAHDVRAVLLEAGSESEALGVVHQGQEAFVAITIIAHENSQLAAGLRARAQVAENWP